ncbi:MAG: histidine phosphatase family protein [Pirellulales bacterium]|nr:histidine phosphatase family protein [Pirellulales bacterium]
MPPCPAPETCWLYLIRHGATANNRARPPRLQGRRTDPVLSGEGHDQARRTGQALAAADLGAVFSSPLSRARQTAEAIAGPHGLSVETVEDLIEVDVGDWEGRPWDEIERMHPEAYRLFMADAGVNPYLGGETIGVVQARVVPALERLMAENLGRVIAAVAHNVVNRAYLAHLLGVPLAKYRSIPQDNCGVNLLRFRGGQAKPITVNAIAHLDDGG